MGRTEMERRQTGKVDSGRIDDVATRVVRLSRTTP